MFIFNYSNLITYYNLKKMMEIDIYLPLFELDNRTGDAIASFTTLKSYKT